VIPTVTAAAVPEQAVVLDVREDDEWVAGHIAGARHVPMFDVPHELHTLAASDPLVVVCKVGGRSAQVTAWLVQQGYDAVNLDGGLLAWERAGRPLVSEDGSPPRVV
jgi:rhodanese-related sulfurtransferase